MSVFNPKTQLRELFNPVRHAGKFVVLYVMGGISYQTVAQIIGPESLPRQAVFNLVDYNEKKSYQWHDIMVPYIFDTADEAQAYKERKS